MNRHRTWTAALGAALLAGCAAAGGPAPLPVPDAAPGALERAVDSIAEAALRRPVPGMTVGVARGGRVLLVKGYGQADVERGTAAAADTRYQIGSVTKTFTAAAIMHLADAGRLRLHQPVTDFVEGVPREWASITLTHLLTHTSGLKSYTELLTRDTYLTPLPPGRVVEMIAGAPANFGPGEDWRYDNSAYFLLGLVVEKVTGKAYGEFLREAFFEPLGMTATGICGTGTPAPRGYSAERGGVPERAPVMPAQLTMGAGALCSTVPDLLRWQHALATGRVVSDGAWARMREPLALRSGERRPYGMGLNTTDLHGRPYVWHNGGIFGFKSQLGYYPADSLTVVVLSNAFDWPAERTEHAVARRALGLPDTAPGLRLTSGELRSFAGVYTLDGMRWEVVAEDGGLVAAGQGQPRFRLSYLGGGAFSHASDPRIRMRFAPGADCEVRLSLYVGPERTTGVREQGAGSGC